MKSVMRTLGWVGIVSLYTIVLVILIVQWAPQSIMSFHTLFPSEGLLNLAIWGSVLFAILSVLIVLRYAAHEKKCTWITRIKYGLFAIFLLGIGVILGYAGTIRAGEGIGNFFLKDSMSDSAVEIQITEKKSNKYCEAVLSIAKKENITSFYDKIVDAFTPSELCVSSEIYNGIEEGEVLTMVGKSHPSLGFFLEQVATPKQVEEIRKRQEEGTLNTPKSENAEENKKEEVNEKPEESETPEDQEKDE